MEATLTFTTLKMAEDFAKAWSRKSMKGHTIGSGAENVSVLIDGITDELKIWIDMYVANINNNEK